HLAGAAAAADRLVRRARRDPHPAVPGGHRQLRLVELADDPGGVLRDQRFLPALGRGRALARLGVGALAGGRRARDGRGLAAVVAPAGPRRVRRAHGALLEAAAEPVLPRPADERELRPLPPGQRLRRLRLDDRAALRGDHRGHSRRRSRCGRRGGVAAVRVQGQARGRAAAVAPVRSLPPAAGLADVVPGAAPGRPALVRGAAGEAAQRRPGGAPAAAHRPLRRRGADGDPGALLRVPIREPRRTAGGRGCECDAVPCAAAGQESAGNSMSTLMSEVLPAAASSRACGAASAGITAVRSGETSTSFRSRRSMRVSKTPALLREPRTSSSFLISRDWLKVTSRVPLPISTRRAPCAAASIALVNETGRPVASQTTSKPSPSVASSTTRLIVPSVRSTVPR